MTITGRKDGVSIIYLDEESIKQFGCYLEEQECSRATIAKYLRDARRLAEFCRGAPADKAQLIAFKQHLQKAGYAPSSVNSMLAAVNCYLKYAGHPEWKLRFLKIRRGTFANRSKELSQDEYERMVSKALEHGDDRLALLLQTICATGIRVSELQAISVESLNSGRAELRSKGKIRMILIPRKLCQMLRRYCREQRITDGCVFVTKNGQPLDRSNIWKMMKRAAEEAKVKTKKVYPHNLRHLFAQTYYKKYKDIVRLADILGHSNVDTTRIYTAKNGQEQQKQIEHLSLLL